MSLTAGAIIGASAIGAAGSAGGSAISSAINYVGNKKLQKKQMKWASNEAQIQRDYEERMSNTAYQRAVADMQEAGINPASLSAGSHQASTPSGAAASGGSAHFSGNIDLGISQAVNTAMSLTLLKNKNEFQQELYAAQKNYLNEQSDLVREQRQAQTAKKLHDEAVARYLNKKYDSPFGWANAYKYNK